MRTEQRHAETAWKVLRHLRKADGSDQDSIEAIASIIRFAVDEAVTAARSECIRIAEEEAQKTLQPGYAH